MDIFDIFHTMVFVKMIDMYLKNNSKYTQYIKKRNTYISLITWVILKMYISNLQDTLTSMSIISWPNSITFWAL